MAITLIEQPRTVAAFVAAAGIVVRAGLELVVFGLRNPGRAAAINRRSGKVVPA